MTGKPKSPYDPLATLTDEFVTDVMASSDEQIRAETLERRLDPTEEANRIKGLMRAAEAKLGKQRMQEAKRGVAGARAAAEPNVVAIARARELLRIAADRDPDLGQRLTLAARNGEALSDGDIQNMVQDLIELGAISDSDEP